MARTQLSRRATVRRPPPTQPPASCLHITLATIAGYGGNIICHMIGNRAITIILSVQHMQHLMIMIPDFCFGEKKVLFFRHHQSWCNIVPPCIAAERPCFYLAFIQPKGSFENTKLICAAKATNNTDCLCMDPGFFSSFRGKTVFQTAYLFTITTYKRQENVHNSTYTSTLQTWLEVSFFCYPKALF